MPRVLSQSDVADFRERLCATAARLFADKGVDGMTMRELASALGVSAMTPYRYFRDKEDILAAVRTRAFGRFADAMSNAHQAGKPVAQAYVHFALEHPSEYALMFALNQPDENDYPELVVARTRAKATMTEHIRPLVEQGVLQGDPDLIGHVYWAMLHGAVTLHLAGKLQSQYTPAPQYGIDRIVAEATRALGAGFRAGTTTEQECVRKT